MQVERLTTLLGEYGVDPEKIPPVLVAAAVQGLAFGVVSDQAAGYETMADEAAAAMGRLVDQPRGGARRADATPVPVGPVADPTRSRPADRPPGLEPATGQTYSPAS